MNFDFDILFINPINDGRAAKKIYSLKNIDKRAIRKNKNKVLICGFGLTETNNIKDKKKNKPISAFGNAIIFKYVEFNWIR